VARPLPGLEDARRSLNGANHENASRDLFEFLLDRPRKLFSHDRRVVAQFAVSEGAPGDFKVSAATQLPYLTKGTLDRRQGTASVNDT